MRACSPSSRPFHDTVTPRKAASTSRSRTRSRQQRWSTISRVFHFPSPSACSAAPAIRPCSDAISWARALIRRNTTICLSEAPSVCGNERGAGFFADVGTSPSRGVPDFLDAAADLAGAALFTALVAAAGFALAALDFSLADFALATFFFGL